jgi:hypothetical protein
MSDKWDRKEKLTVGGIVLTLISVSVSAFLIYTQIRQNNVLIWKAAIETESNELAKLPILNPAISCIYRHQEKAIEDQCTLILREPGNRRQALMYVAQVLSFYGEVRAFGQEHDKRWAKGFQPWIEQFAKLDITSYYLFINEIHASQALREFGVKTEDARITEGYLRFQRHIGFNGQQN